MKKLFVSFLVIASAITMLSAQEPCSATEHFEKLKQNDPHFAKRHAEIEKYTQNFVRQYKAGNRSSSMVTIPVVVHVVYNTSAQNLSDNVIQSQIDALNEDFRRLNSDANQTRSVFQSVAGDPLIEFCLASKNPAGGPTNGITRTQTTVTSFNPSYNNMKSNATGGKDPWPNTQYLNIWVCALQGNVIGFAYFPGAPGSIDGVVVHWQTFGRTGNHLIGGYEDGRTTTHEVGHYLNLYHPFQGGCSGTSATSCATSGDRVCDTPPVSSANFGCPNNPNSCTETPSDQVDQYENYMDYTWDFCKNMFSNGQITRMQALFSPGGVRHSLVNSTACATPDPCDGGIFPPITENFEIQPPASWEVENPDGGKTWENSSNITGVNGSTTKAAFVDNFNYNSSGSKDYLVSENIDLTQTNTASLSFDLAYARYNSSFFERLKVEVSIDCGGFNNVVYDKSGTDLATTSDQSSSWFPSSASDWRSESLDLDAFTGNIITVRFVNITGYGNNLFLDNINIETGTATCDQPQNLLVGNITSNSATLNWSSVSGADSYLLRGRALNTPAWVSFNVSSNSLNASNLDNRLYEWQVRSVCNNGSENSQFSLRDTFGIGCYEPVSLWTTDITNNQAILNWTPVPNAISYIIRGRLSGTSAWLSIPTLTTSYPALGLASGNAYEWQVKASCLTEISSFSGLNLFATSGNTESTTPGQLFIPENENWEAFIYPNPVTSNADLRIDGLEGTVSILVLNSIGQTLIEAEVEVANTKVVQLDLGDLESGMYFCRITSASSEKIISFIKE